MDPSNAVTGRLFYNEESGALCRVMDVDTSYAYIEVLLPDHSSYSVPIREYDSTWATHWRPATAEDVALLGGTEGTYRPPANAAELWSETS